MASIGGGGTSNVEPGGSVGGVCRVKLFSPARILPATNAIAVARNKAEANAPNCRAPSEFFISEPRGSANGKTRNADRAAKRTPTSRGCVSSHRLSPASSLNRGDAPPAPASSATLKCSAENRLRAPKLTRVSPAAREAANGVNLHEGSRNRKRPQPTPLREAAFSRSTGERRAPQRFHFKSRTPHLAAPLLRPSLIPLDGEAARSSLRQWRLAMVIGVTHIQPIVSLIAGVLILVMPNLLNYIVAIFLIISGILGLGLIH